MTRKISNTQSPEKNISNTKKPHKQKLHIDFTIYSNWKNSCTLKRGSFTNHYRNRKHVEGTLSDILFKVFPHIQNNISKIISGKEDHCHIVDGDKKDLVWDIIDKIYINNRMEREIDIYQMGITGSTRVFGSLLNTGDQYEFYPLFIDCNHLVYPNPKHNQMDHKKFKNKIK